MSGAGLPYVGRWLALASLVAAIGGCAAMKLGYNNADTLVLFQLGSYVDLTPDQELTVKERANGLLSWHRSTQLRDYASFVDKARAKLSGQVTAADVAEFNQQANARMLALADRAAPDIAHLALTLTPQQIDQIAKKIANDAAKARRELTRANEKDPAAERVKKYGERAETWFGKLNDGQRDIIRKSMANRPNEGTWWIDERERRQREFVALLRKVYADKPAEEAAAKWFRAYFTQLNQTPDTERRARTEQYRRHSAELIAQLVNSATPEQRAHLDKKLAEYAQDFRALAGVTG